MDTVPELYDAVREKFPQHTLGADAEHTRIWGELDRSSAYSWFESLAKFVNLQMSREAPASEYQALLKYLAGVAGSGSAEIRDCIDASFTENLFWQVPKHKAEPYWSVLPERLKGFYVAFHNRTPL